MLQSGILFVLIYSHISVILSKDDPCNSFLEINDTTMSVAYTVSDNDPISCKKLKPFLWYRYIGSDKGYLTNVCPNKGQCGSRSQIWFKGTVPSVDDGETLARVCISKDGSCCNLHSRLKIKNCTDFIVYFVIPTSPCTHYCFAEFINQCDFSNQCTRHLFQRSNDKYNAIVNCHICF
ncbi:oncoprotein-induced transcript 3 protein-like [Ruditapes philippinarum]|uniref:oncoprotein-induced transcript 3 protein-like n=1 Tax=Ruditapes philippinarum TaxID=129788 RepID=UPI00295BA9C0|nr:oncoprotein-induced transcript 3 protein-like [Ruditapes philippinarum]